MQFDWFTFGAQLINFLLLLMLLRRFLFTPIQRAMRAREDAITARFQEAEQQAKKAADEEARWRSQQQAFEAKRAQLLTEAEAEAENMRKQMVQDARAEAGELQERWHAALAHEQTEFLQTLRQRLNEQLFAVARRALSDLANTDLERQIVAVFLQRLQHLAPQERARLVEAVQESREAVVIRSTFVLQPDQRRELAAQLKELVGEMIDLQFGEAPELSCGIELQVYGQRIAWSLQHYLAEMEDHFAALLKADAATVTPKVFPDQTPT